MPGDDFDPNKLAAEVIIQATERVVSATADPLRTRVRRTLQILSDAYSPFLEKTFKRVSTIRTFLKPTESVDLLQHYVPVSLTDKVSDFEVDEIIGSLSKGGCYVVSGLAGRGKSVLMRYIALCLYHAPRGRIPLFLELRNLNSLTTKNILQLIHSQYKGDSNISLSDFTEALKRGYFVLVLDGFDEVSPNDRELIERQIVDLPQSYDNVSVIISGRPYDGYASWERFRTLHLKPMSLEQTRLLIDNSLYDEDVKKVFAKRLTPDFYKKHESFLNTPLLAIMLMLTFEEYAEIPVSLHEFYRNAFDTLIRRHDAMKAQFLRKTHSGCTAEEFKKIFSSFCVLTYSKSEFTFHRDGILDHVDTVLKQQRLKYSKTKVLKDLIESICLLQEEGFEISFVHRSFQEYFCALFVSTAPSGMVAKYLDSGRYRIQDDVIPMLYGMIPDRVEQEWANQATRAICETFHENDPDHIHKFAMERYPELIFFPSERGVGPIAMHDSKLARTVNVLKRIYPAHFAGTSKNNKMFSSKKQADLWHANVLAEVIALEKSGDIQLRGFEEAVNLFKKSEERQGTFSLKPDMTHKKLMNVIFQSSFEDEMKALRQIQKDQKSREKGSDNFLKEVFSA